MVGESLAVIRARNLAATVKLPTPFSVRALLLDLEVARRRRIVLHPVEAGWAGTSGWCGAWLEEVDVDHIVFIRDPLSTVRNAGTVLHEVGHILLNHLGAMVPRTVDLTSLGLSSVRRARGRTAFGDPEERAAETFSSLVLQSALARGAVALDADTVDPRALRLQSRLA